MSFLIIFIIYLFLCNLISINLILKYNFKYFKSLEYEDEKILNILYYFLRYRLLDLLDNNRMNFASEVMSPYFFHDYAWTKSINYLLIFEGLILGLDFRGTSYH